MKCALITGITDQGGFYLAEFLPSKEYRVHGIKRRASLFNTDRINLLHQDPHVENKDFILHNGDPRYLHPTEVEVLLGDLTKFKKSLVGHRKPPSMNSLLK